MKLKVFITTGNKLNVIHGSKTAVCRFLWLGALITYIATCFRPLKRGLSKTLQAIKDKACSNMNRSGRNKLKKKRHFLFVMLLGR